jgi:crotonobetainyl-CoA:carnitine CoA-transferase CaiB-like acyl-CoA transferase
MLDAAIAFLWPDAAMDKALLADDARRSPTIGANYAITRLADGYCTGAAVSDAEFRGWCAALGRPELADDPRFATMLDRSAHLTHLVVIMTELAAHTPMADFLARAEEHDVPASAVNTLDTLPHDAQVVHNEVFTVREHPLAGPLREPRQAARFSTTSQELGGPAPAFGEHSDEVVTELGLDAVALRAAGVIA